MFDEFPCSEVQLSSLSAPESELEAYGTLVRGAFYRHRDGSLYHAVCVGLR